MSDVPREIRRDAAILARRKKARSSAFSCDAPTDWRPQTVLNPVVDGDYFTPDGAWEFIAERLEDENQVVEWIELKKATWEKGTCNDYLGGSERHLHQGSTRIGKDQRAEFPLQQCRPDLNETFGGDL